MKTIKIMISIVVAFMFVFFASNTFAQTDEENHANLTRLHQVIIKHTDAVTSGEAKTINDKIMRYNEARKSFADAKKMHNLLKKVLPVKLISVAIVHHDNIDKYHVAALAYFNSMANELKNSNPDDANLKEGARKIHDAISLAEKEHQALIKDTK